MKFRQYRSPSDFKLVSDFLIRHFKHRNADGNWLQPAWEYMHCHPYLDESALEKIGIWEDSGEIVGVAHYESRLGEIFFELHPNYHHLKREMLEYAEDNLWGETDDKSRYVRVYVNDFDKSFEEIVRSWGYQMAVDYTRPMCLYTIPPAIPRPELPAGFYLKSLADDNDLVKIHRVLWRGFDHPGEPPAEGIEGRVKMQSGPNFRKDLTIVAVAPDENFVSFCGTWFEATNRIAYVEPVATDPDFRRRGLGRATVMEGIRRCAELGATAAFVGSDLPFYQALGFEKVYNSNCWVKTLDG